MTVHRPPTEPGASDQAEAQERPAVILLSGGLDSATCLALAQRDGFDPIALSFAYGQRHSVELDAADALARRAGIDHVVANIDLGIFGGSALTDTTMAVPKHDQVSDLDASDIPTTYVPARNTIFLSFALALAEVRGATDIFIGVNALDYSGYPDCRPDYIEAYSRLANLATRSGVDGDESRPIVIHTPLLHLHKSEIITLATGLGVDLAATVSCYDPTAEGGACGHCDACLLRADGFRRAAVTDPTRYAATTSPKPDEAAMRTR